MNAPFPGHRHAISVNGRFLGRAISGVERYGRELLLAWDALIDSQPGHPPVRILMPRGSVTDIAFRNMRIEQVGRLGGHGWEQVDLAIASRHDVLVSLANSGPVTHPRHVAVIHDAAVFRFPENYGWRYRLAHTLISRGLARTARLATVSEFSRGELVRYLGVDGDTITVCPNGSEHLGRVAPDLAIATRLGLDDGEPMLLTVGTASRNKNLALVLEAWRRLAPARGRLVVAGPVTERIFGGGPAFPQLPGVIYPGRVSDAELSALYGRAAALVFPSRYEGFGIPPLEAMVHGSAVLAADIPPVREVCADAARYFPVDDPDALAILMRDTLDGAPRPTAAAKARVEHYRWSKSAAILANLVRTVDRVREKAT